MAGQRCQVIRVQARYVAARVLLSYGGRREQASSGESRVKRRSLLKAAVLGSGAAFAAPAISKGLLEWRMVTSWPRGLPGLGTGAERLAANITAMSGGRLTIKVYCGRRTRARARMLRRGRERHRADGARRRLLPHGQVGRLRVLHRVSVRLHDGRDGRVDQARQRPETLGRVVRAVRHPRLPGGQHGHADVRLVPPRDPLARRPAGTQVPHAGQPGSRAAEARRHSGLAAGWRDLPGAAIGRDRRRRMGRPVQRPRARLLPGLPVLLFARLPRAGSCVAAHRQRTGVAFADARPAGNRARRLPMPRRPTCTRSTPRSRVLRCARS